MGRSTPSTGSGTSTGVSSTPRMRRTPAPALCTRSRVSTTICTGSTSRFTRNRKASRLPADTPRPAPSHTPKPMTAAVIRPANSSAEENRNAPRRLARNSARNWPSSARCTRSRVASSAPYARTTARPEMASPTAARLSATRPRTRSWARPRMRWNQASRTAYTTTPSTTSSDSCQRYQVITPTASTTCREPRTIATPPKSMKSCTVVMSEVTRETRAPRRSPST